MDSLREQITTKRITDFEMIKEIKDKTIVKATIKEVQDSIFKANKDVNSVSAEVWEIILEATRGDDEY